MWRRIRRLLCWLSWRAVLLLFLLLPLWRAFQMFPSVVYCGCAAQCCCSNVNVLVCGGDFFSFWSLILCSPPLWGTPQRCAAPGVRTRFSRWLIYFRLRMWATVCVCVCDAAAIICTYGQAFFCFANSWWSDVVSVFIDYCMGSCSRLVSLYPNRCSCSAFLLHIYK